MIRNYLTATETHKLPVIARREHGGLFSKTRKLVLRKRGCRLELPGVQPGQARPSTLRRLVLCSAASHVQAAAGARQLPNKAKKKIFFETPTRSGKPGRILRKNESPFSRTASSSVRNEM